MHDKWKSAHINDMQSEFKIKYFSVSLDSIDDDDDFFLYFSFYFIYSGRIVAVCILCSM